MRFGLVSDTHIPGSMRELWPQVADAFRGVDAILHAGDIVTPGVLDWLGKIAPVVAAEGNHDAFMANDPRVKKRQILQAGGFQIGLIHIFEPLDWTVDKLLQFYFNQPLDIVVIGDTHWEIAEVRDGVLLVNPGSPTYPHNMETRLGMVGFLEIDGPKAQAQVYQLHESTGLTLVTSASITKAV